MQSSLRGWRGVCAAVVASAIAGIGSVSAQDLASFEKRLTVHTLPNGYTFLILERPGAPVFSFATRVDVGSAQEVPGITGLAHMFEHMAFKGTPRLGTKDYAKEKVALDELEAAYQAYERARAAGRSPTRPRSSACSRPSRSKEAAAQEFVVANEFDEALIARGRRRPERRAPAPSDHATTTRCRPTSSSCWPTSSPSASSTPCSASSTRSATW